MIIIHGDDYPSSYQKLTQILAKIPQSKSFSAKNLDMTLLTQLLSSADLFGETPTVVLENVFSLPASKAKDKLLEFLKSKIDASIILYETKAINGNSLRAFAKATIHEQVPEVLVFKFLDQVYAGNAARIIPLYEQLISKGHAPEYLLAMLVWHYRSLLSGTSNPTLPSWQAAKLKNLLKLYPVAQIIDDYQLLYQIDSTNKNGLSILPLHDLLYSFFAKL